MNGKQALRQSIRLARQAYSPAELAQMSKPIIERLRSMSLWRTAATVLLYSSLPDEVFTHALIEEAYAEKKVLLPVVTGAETMELRLYSGLLNTQTGRFGISEPVGRAFTNYSQIDMAVVPGLAFDDSGHRLGRGRGYYDRMLARLSQFRIPVYGICFDFQRVSFVPTDEHDVSVCGMI